MKNTKLIVRIICIILAILMIGGLLINVIPIFASADTSAIDEQLQYLEAQKTEKANKVSEAQNKLDALKAQQSDEVEKKMALEERNEAAAEEIELIEKQIDIYNQMIAAKSKEVDAAQKKEDNQLAKYQNRVRAMEENGSENILALILNAKSFSGLLASIEDYGDVMNSDKKLYDEFIEARTELESVKEAYERDKEKCDHKMLELEEEQRNLLAEIRESEKTLEELAEKIKQAEEEQKAADAALNAASASVSSFLTLYYQQKNSSAENGSFTDSSTGVTYDTSTQYSDSGYIWPFPASHTISSGYKQRWGRLHSGVDIDGFNLSGSPIVAARGGTVILAGWNGGYGNCVMIDHGDAVTLYGHMSSLSVGVGQAVSQGTTVGGCGMTGSATGVHLHFEVRINGNTVDPIGYLPSGWTAGADAFTSS